MSRRVSVDEAQRIIRRKAEMASGMLMLELAKRIVDRTPVGDPDLWKAPAPPGYVGGTARGNWQAGRGRPDDTVDENVQDKTGDATIMRAQAAFNRAALGQNLYFTNTLPYIKRLEYDGWSTQAPAGMVRVSMAELSQRAREVAAIVRRAYV